ncbi:MAG: AmpG family muropeptide MFS transporter [Rickettsiales bacterium]
MLSWLKLYLQPRLLVVLVLGFISGLPLALSASTLSVWLAESNVSLSSIGMFALVGTPYTLKFLWSPLIDGLKLPLFTKLFGRRCGWMLAIQLLLMASLVALGMCNPMENLLLAAFFALMVAISSATQDIVIDAYRVEILSPEEQGAGAAMVVLGYRLGMIVSAAGALFLATAYGWAVTYVIMAALVPMAWLAIMVGGEPQVVDSEGLLADNEKEKNHSSSTAYHSLSVWLNKHIIEPFTDFMQREAWLGILLFILLYKLGDAFMGVMTNPFLIDIGFTKNQIATVVKFYGLIATIIGSFIGGALVMRIGMMRTLWICGIAHAITNLMFVAQARIGADETFLAISISLENISGGMGTAAFVAFISSLVNLRFTATQYALLSSFSAFGRTWLSAPAGWFAETLGWEWFFVFSVLLAIPGLVTLWWLSKRIFIKQSKAT